MTLHLPTRELVGLIGDVHRFASADPDDTTWHGVVIRWDGERLHALAGDGSRLAWMSWGPDDGDAPTIPGLDTNGGADDPWELTITPENAKEIVTKFKLSVTLGETPVRVTGAADSLRIERDSEIAGVALRSVALAGVGADDLPDIATMIDAVARDAADRDPRPVNGYDGAALADFCNPKTVRQRGAVLLRPGRVSTYIMIGDYFQGAIRQTGQADA